MPHVGVAFFLIAAHWAILVLVTKLFDSKLRRRQRLRQRQRPTTRHGDGDGDGDVSSCDQVEPRHEWLATVPVVALNSEQMLGAASNVLLNGPLATLTAFLCPLPAFLTSMPSGETYAILPATWALACAEATLGCILVDTCLWACHALSHSPPGKLSPHLPRLRAWLAEKHKKRHAVGCIRNPRGAFCGDSLEHFALTFVAAGVVRATTSSFVSAAAVCAVITTAALYTSAFGLSTIQHHYDAARGDSKSVPPSLLVATLSRSAPF
jgi:hypothetical protein